MKRPLQGGLLGVMRGPVLGALMMISLLGPGVVWGATDLDQSKKIFEESGLFGCIAHLTDRAIVDCHKEALYKIFQNSPPIIPFRGTLADFLDGTKTNGIQDMQWIPARGRLDIYQNQMQLQFSFDSNAIRFFRESTLLSTEQRFPMNLEIDLSPAKEFPFFGKNLPDGGVTFSASGNLEDAGFMLDTNFGDSGNGYGFLIVHPEKLKAGEMYSITIHSFQPLTYYEAKQFLSWIQSGNSSFEYHGNINEDPASLVRLSFQISVDRQAVADIVFGEGEKNMLVPGGVAYRSFIVKNNGFTSIPLDIGSSICWYATHGDDPGCRARDVIEAAPADAINTQNFNSSTTQQTLVVSSVALPTPPPSDLKVKSVWLETNWGSESYAYGTSEEVVMKAQFQNIGKGTPDKDVKVRFYLSRGEKKDSSSDWERVGEDMIKAENLKPGKTHTETETLRLWRDSLKPGKYNIVVCADRIKDSDNGGGSIVESDEKNNCSDEEVFEVKDVPVYNTSPFDLTISNVEIFDTLMPMSADGTFRVKMSVRNIGTKELPMTSRSVYEIKGPSTNDQWVELTGDDSEGDQLKPGRDEWEETKTALPAPSLPGTYTLRVRADAGGVVPESDETNNSKEVSFAVVRRYSDFTVPSAEIYDTGMPMRVGTTFRVKTAIRNIGEIAPFVDIRSVYEIKGPSTGGAWVVLTDDGSEPDDFTPGRDQWEETKTALPVPSVPGAYVLRVRADSNNSVAESDETNNTKEVPFSVYEPLPNLTISSVQIYDTALPMTAGGTFRVKMAVRNVGDLTPAAGIRSVYEVNGPSTGGNWVVLTDDGSDAGELTPGRDQWEETKTALSVPSVPGTYTLRVRADSTGSVRESNENDNTMSTTFQVVERLPDLVISGVSISGGLSVKKGKSFSPQMWIQNIGQVGIPRGIRSAYYVDGGYVDDDGTDPGDLTPGKVAYEEIKSGIKVNSKGSHLLRVCADHQGSVQESNESNNCAEVWFTVK